MRCIHEGVSRRRPDRPVLITDAPENQDDELDRRSRRYGIMMGLRVLCVIAAALVYHASVWLALAFIVGGAVLPWCAVIMANDRPPKNRSRLMVHRSAPPERALPAAEKDRTIDG
jgi:Flp pilus assembly protein TadB